MKQLTKVSSQKDTSKQLSIRKKNNPMKKWAEDLNRRFYKENMQLANKNMNAANTAHY